MDAAGQLAGEVLADRYRLLEVLGEGSMGRVYEAEDVELGRRVAVKILYPWLANDAGAVRRLLHEARTLARLCHPNIVQVHDCRTDSRGTFLVSELVEGQSLATLAGRRRLEPQEAIRIVRAVCDALAYAHSRLVVHRDIKPANIMISADGTVKVTDFGVARISTGVTSHTVSGTMIGTPLYISPEQARGRRASAASDIYSLGVVAYELLAGGPPFTADTPIALAIAHVDDDPPPLPEDVSVSPSVRRAVRTALEKDPSQRHADAEAFSEALRAGSPRVPPAPSRRTDLDETRTLAPGRAAHATGARSARTRPPALTRAAFVVGAFLAFSMGGLAAVVTGVGDDYAAGAGPRLVTLVEERTLTHDVTHTVTQTETQTVTDPGVVPVPSVAGQQLDQARAALASAGLDSETVGGGMFGIGDETEWIVAAQDPLAGVQVPPGESVTLEVDRR